MRFQIGEVGGSGGDGLSAIAKYWFAVSGTGTEYWFEDGAVIGTGTGYWVVWKSRSSVLVLETGSFWSRGHRYWYWVLGCSGVAVMSDPAVLVLSTDLKDLRSSGIGTGWLGTDTGYWVVGVRKPPRFFKGVLGTENTLN